MNKPVYRRSVIEAMLSCAAYEPSAGENAAFGSAVHEAVAAYQLQCQAAGEETRLADVDRLAHAAFFREAQGIDPGRWEEMRSLVQHWAETHTAGLGTLMGVEKTLALDCGDFVVTGTVDRLDRVDGDDPDDAPRVVRITDWKTQWSAQPHEFQMRFYAGLVFASMPSVQVVETWADHFRGGGQVVKAEWHRPEAAVWMADVLSGFRHRLADVERPAVGGSACTYCAKATTCGSAVESVKSAPADDEVAAGMFRDLLRLEAAVKGHKSALQKWFSDREPAVVGGNVVGYLPRSEFEIVDPAAALAELERAGCMTASLSLPLAKVPNKHRPLLLDLGLAVQRPGSPQFGHKTAVPAGESDEA